MLFKYLQWILLIPVIVGTIYGFLCVFAMLHFRVGYSDRPERPRDGWPAVTILKPICGLNKGLEENLRSVCSQDYPEYQVIISCQDHNDPAISVMQKIRREFPDKVELVVKNTISGPNGKINNLSGALPHAKYDILVISDSDIRLSRLFLKRIIAPLCDPNVGYVCTPYRAARADKWYEKLSLLALNADFVPGIIFAYLTGIAEFCLGSSVALRRIDLTEVGGIEAFAGYLTEDYEMGKRILVTGKKMVLTPFWVETLVDLRSPSQWWNDRILWDQKTRSANPVGFFSTVVTRSVPFAFFLAACRMADYPGMTVLVLTVLIRVASAALILKLGMKDAEGLRALWLLPASDMVAFASWMAALTRRIAVWRDSSFTLTHSGRVERRDS